MGFQFTASNYVLDPNFYNAIVEEITPKQTQFGPALVFKFGIMDNLLLKKSSKEDDKYSLGKKVQKTFTAKAVLPNGDLDFAPTGEYRNTVEMLVSKNGLDINAVARDEKLLIGCVCRLVVVNSLPDKNGAIWNNIQKAGIIEPNEATFAAVNNYKIWRSQQPTLATNPQYAGNANTVSYVPLQAQPPQPMQHVQPGYQPQQVQQPPQQAQPPVQPPVNPAGGAVLNDKSLFN